MPTEDLARKILGLPTEQEEKILTQEVTGKKRPRQEWFWLDIPKDRKFFTPEEVARLLLFNIQTVWRWCRTGKIPTYKVGRFYRISAEDLSKLLDERKLLMKNGRGNSPQP